MGKFFKFLIILVIGYTVAWFALAKTGVGVKALQVAAAQNQPALAKTFLTLGAKPNAKTPEGLTALHVAAYLGADAVAKVFLDRGARVDERDMEGRTPLHLAAYQGHAGVVAILLERGADIRAVESKNRMTPLHLAALQGKTETVKILIDKGADVNAGAAHGATPYTLAQQGGHSDTARLIRQNGGEE